jgi:hypothetical protein
VPYIVFHAAMATWSKNCLQEPCPDQSLLSHDTGGSRVATDCRWSCFHYTPSFINRVSTSSTVSKHAAAPAPHIRLATHAYMCGDDGFDDDAGVPETAPPVRRTPHTPQKLNDFPTDSATYVPVLALPVSPAPRAASSSARCIHVSSSTQPGEH